MMTQGAAKEVKHESVYRVSNEIAANIIKQQDQILKNAISQSLQNLQSKYMTGLSSEKIFGTLRLDNYFHDAITFLKSFYEIIMKVLEGKMAKEEFTNTMKTLCANYKQKLPIHNFFYSFLPSIDFSEEEKRILNAFSTGNLIESKYREYTLYSNFPLLAMHLRGSQKYDVLTPEHFDYMYSEISKLDKRLVSFLHEIYHLFSLENSQMTEVLEKTQTLIKKSLDTWSKDKFKEILIALFGGEESLRLELKYTGISAEKITVDDGIKILTDVLKLPFDDLGKFETARVHKEGSVEAAIEEVCKQRPKYPLLQTNLQKKTFIRSLNVKERNVVWKALKTMDFNDYIKAKAIEKGKSIDISTMSESAIENFYEDLEGEHWTDTLFKQLQEKKLGEESSKSSEGMKLAGSVEDIKKFERVEAHFTKARSRKVVLDKEMGTKALIRGLSDQECSDLSKLLFNTPSASKEDCMNEIARLFDNKEMYASAGIENVVKDHTNLKENLPKYLAFVDKIISYSLSPAAKNLEIAVDYINWLRRHVNDIHLVAESPDIFRQQLGKRTIYTMLEEMRAVFPVYDAQIAVALISSLISRVPFEDVLVDVNEFSALIDDYTQEKVPLKKDLQLWSVVNEIWIRHLRRERKVKVKKEKADERRETKEDKAKKIFIAFEEALMPYSYALRGKDMAWGPLHFTTEEKLSEALKHLANNLSLLDVEFVVGREDIAVGQDQTLGTKMVLMQALINFIEEDFRGELTHTIEKFRNSESHEDVSFDAAEIVDIFNRSLARRAPGGLDAQYIHTIREFSQKYVSLFNRSKFTSKVSRNQAVDEIFERMAPEFIELTKHKDYNYVRAMLSHVLEDSIIIYLREYTEAFSPFDKDKTEERMARALFGRGLKSNNFTKLLNHLLQERRKGSAEVGTDTWARYSDKCRYVLRRIDKTCYIIK